MVGGQGPLLDWEATDLDDSEWVLLECHRFLASISGANKLVMNLGLFVMDKVALVDTPDIKHLIKAVANLCIICRRS